MGHVDHGGGDGRELDAKLLRGLRMAVSTNCHVSMGRVGERGREGRREKDI